MSEIKFTIEKTIGVISQGTKGWTKELNLVSWNDKDAKYDIREWSPEHDRMSKGITFTKEELLKLKELISQIEK
ncbi:MAG TPA: PC4/YdbC family ssDNA-binding protein [Haloplasmataceae bacterium]